MIAIIDSGGANIASVQFALERLGAESVLTKDVKIIQSADKVLLPGVGAAPIAMQNLAEYELIDCIRGLTQPVMGICLGMQLLFAVSPEGNTPLLGIFDADCETFTPAQGRSVPHMGWNRLSKQQDHPLLAGVDEGAHVYFVHSYFAPVTTQTIAATNYGDDFTAIVAENNFMGCQFHPEKSGLVGAQILRNFLEMPS
ncbi:imidazole glycerol phosphate synthase subunit HisH [Alphaproteobacteria bacterium]|nr:imidazole glycerol phosphate synthase subunit HisH [Alphaproteobacteria bacterium]